MNDLPVGLQDLWDECVHAHLLDYPIPNEIVVRHWRSCYDRLHGYACGNRDEPELNDTLARLAFNAYWEAKYGELYEVF